MNRGFEVSVEIVEIYELFVFISVFCNDFLLVECLYDIWYRRTVRQVESGSMPKNRYLHLLRFEAFTKCV